METKLIVSNKLLYIIDKKTYINYEIIEELENNTSYIRVNHSSTPDIFYLGYQMGIESLSQAFNNSGIHSLPMVSQDKGHSQGNQTTEDKSAQGNQ
jgi:hypothetical protein